MSRLMPALILSACSALVLGGCTSTSTDRSLPPRGADPGIEHVHGLGVPTRLGLIRSDDAGESWELVSLGGVVDFHVLIRLTAVSTDGIPVRDG